MDEEIGINGNIEIKKGIMIEKCKGMNILKGCNDGYKDEEWEGLMVLKEEV